MSLPTYHVRQVCARQQLQGLVEGRLRLSQHRKLLLASQRLAGPFDGTVWVEQGSPSQAAGLKSSCC